MLKFLYNYHIYEGRHYIGFNNSRCCRCAGLSVGTVSKYINGKTVKENTRLAIEEAIKELDFHPNNIAKDYAMQNLSLLLFCCQC